MRRSLTISIATASLGLLVMLLVVRLGTWTPRWWLDSLDTFALYAFVPFLATIVAALSLRSRILAAISVGAVALFAQQFGALTIESLNLSGPTAAEASPQVVHLRVLTLNAHASFDDPEPLVAVLTESRPDIVILQEVSSQYAGVMQAAIGSEYPFSFSVGLDTEHQGSATWSRFPLNDPAPFQLDEHGNVLHRVRVATDAGEIWVYNVHLSNPTGADHGHGRLSALRRFHADRRDAELHQLVRRTAGLDAPVVLAGDFNISAGSRAYRSFPPMWRDAFAEAGRGFGHSYPAPAHEQEGDDWLKIPFPLLRIDYILTSSDILPRRAWTQEVHGSDHLAVIADLELPMR